MFDDSERALNWAFTEITVPIIQESGINQLRRQHRRGLPNVLLQGLTPQERRQQAADIIELAAGLSDGVYREYLAAKYGGRLTQRDLQIMIRRLLAGVGAGVNRATVLCVVRGYFTGKTGYRKVRGLLRCSDAAAISVQADLIRALDAIHERAMAEVRENLERCGVVKAAGV